MMLQDYCKKLCQEIERYCDKEITKSNLETVVFLLECKCKIKHWMNDDNQFDVTVDHYIHDGHKRDIYDAYGEKSKKYSIEHKHELSKSDVREWFDHMKNASGTTGQTWSIEETNRLAKDLNLDLGAHDIHDYIWNVTVNMMYSDYYDTAVKFGTNKPIFYAHLAKDFLLDEDAEGPMKKIDCYYNYIVK